VRLGDVVRIGTGQMAVYLLAARIDRAKRVVLELPGWKLRVPIPRENRTMDDWRIVQGANDNPWEFRKREK
jgi:hypothetical protein